MASADYKKYAEALSAASSDPVKTWRELDQATEVIMRTPLLRQVLLSVSVESPDKRTAVMDQTFSDFSPLLRKFIEMVVRDGHIGSITDITRDYLRQLKSTHHVSEVVIETPRPLSESEQQDILGRLPTTGPLLTTQIVRPELIGGLKVIIDDQEIDLSVGGALTSLKHQLTA